MSDDDNAKGLVAKAIHETLMVFERGYIAPLHRKLIECVTIAILDAVDAKIAAALTPSLRPEILNPVCVECGRICEMGRAKCAECQGRTWWHCEACGKAVYSAEHGCEGSTPVAKPQGPKQPFHYGVDGAWHGCDQGDCKRAGCNDPIIAQIAREEAGRPIGMIVKDDGTLITFPPNPPITPESPTHPQVAHNASETVTSTGSDYPDVGLTYPPAPKRDRFRIEKTDDGDGWSIYEYLDGKRTLVGSDGGQPEDQLLVRDWDWVAYELNRVATESRPLPAAIEALIAAVREGIRLAGLESWGHLTGVGDDGNSQVLYRLAKLLIPAMAAVDAESKK